jgi:hypothetical protein
MGLMGCVVLSVPAPAATIDVKTGLWEMSSERSTSGMPKMPAMPQLPPEVLAAMPPDQQARIRAAMQGAWGARSGKRSRVKKVCITRKSLEQGPAFGADDFGRSCTRNVRANSKRSWDMQVVCNDQGRRQTINVRYEAPRPDTINGTVDIAMSDGNRRMTMQQTMQGRWLGPDCGDVKPRD